MRSSMYRCGAGGRGHHRIARFAPPRSTAVRAAGSSKRFWMGSERALLVAAGGGIGDTLLAGGVARALRTRYDAVDAVVLPAHTDLAAHIPAIERVVPLGAPLPARYDAAVVTWATL